MEAVVLFKWFIRYATVLPLDSLDSNSSTDLRVLLFRTAHSTA